MKVALLLAAALGVASLYSLAAVAGEGNGDQDTVYRFDPDPLTTSPRLIPTEDVKPGHVYSHFSKRLNRRVWSYVQADGTFWHAFGMGTMQPAWRFDVPMTKEEGMEALGEIDPAFERNVRVRDLEVFFCLNGANEWELSKTASFPTIYNAEDGRRWEWSANKYIPVVHIYGWRWAVVGEKYVPAAGY
ncbi:MAG: hypothetical protein ACYTG0_43270 [Planctomycetota bacterium]